MSRRPTMAERAKVALGGSFPPPARARAEASEIATNRIRPRRALDEFVAPVVGGPGAGIEGGLGLVRRDAQLVGGDGGEAFAERYAVELLVVVDVEVARGGQLGQPDVHEARIAPDKDRLGRLQGGEGEA